MKATDRVSFEFDKCRTTCRLFGVGGLRIDRLYSEVDKVARSRPGLMMIDIGTTDVDDQCVTVSELARTVFRLI